MDRISVRLSNQDRRILEQFKGNTISDKVRYAIKVTKKVTKKK